MEQLVDCLLNKGSQVSEWIQSQWQDKIPPIYLSGDLRHSGHKIAVIDSNLFPAGFNNLCSVFSHEVSQSFEIYFNKFYPSVKSILLLIEEHTRNKYYLKNISRLKELLEDAHLEVTLGVLGHTIQEEEIKIDLDDKVIQIRKIHKQADSIYIGNTRPDLILSNNDFSDGYPDLLKEITQPVIPSPNLGWHSRKKSRHFEKLNAICHLFGQAFDIDPWFMTAISQSSAPIDFTSEQSIENLAQDVEALISQVQSKYNEYGIKDSPYVYLKNNSGTYGMGLLPVFSGEEVLSLSRRKKNKLLSSKGGNLVSEFILQEGIPTIDSYSGFPIEPVIYNVGGKDIGGFFRIHESKNELESLNAPGMTFSCLCLHKLEEPHEKFFIECREKEKLVLVARFLSKLDALAVSFEA